MKFYLELIFFNHSKGLFCSDFCRGLLLFGDLCPFLAGKPETMQLLRIVFCVLVCAVLINADGEGHAEHEGKVKVTC